MGGCHLVRNPWRGCTKVSSGCDACYMYRDQRKYGRDPDVVVRCSPATFNAPLSKKWTANAAAALEAGRPWLVFTCSWSDWFHVTADPWRDEAWDVIRRTPHLTYLILTKRHGRIARHLPADWGDGWPNVWLGVSVETDEYLNRIEVLRTIPVYGNQRFVSAEPLLGGLGEPAGRLPDSPATPLGGMADAEGEPRTGATAGSPSLDGIGWVIIGGESGFREEARPMHPQWARDWRDLVLACGQGPLDEAFALGAPDDVLAEGVRDEMLGRDRPLLHMKQFGSWAPVRRDRPRPGDQWLWPNGARAPYDPAIIPHGYTARGVDNEYVGPDGAVIVRYAGPLPSSGGKLLDGVDHCERPGLAPVLV